MNPKIPEDYVPPWEKSAHDVRTAQQRIFEKKAKQKKRQSSRRLRKLRPWLIWSGLILFVYWFYTPHGIFVLGDPLSVGRYRGVLKDLKQQLPAEYQLVRDHIDQISISYIITGGNYAGQAQEGEYGNSKVRLLENTFVQGPGYAHSTLVHEACHGLQFYKQLPFQPFCANQAREHACNQWGLKVLRQFNAKPEMIKYYETIAQGNTVYGNSCMREGKVDHMPDL